jgi:hypothetical protein
MATNTTYTIPAYLTPDRVAANTTIYWEITTPTSGIADADLIDVTTLPAGVKVVDAWLQAAGTLGAGATLLLQINGVSITGATTAAAASLVRMTKQPAISSSALTIRVLVAGAAIAAAARVTVVVNYMNA